MGKDQILYCSSPATPSFSTVTQILGLGNDVSLHPPNAGAFWLRARLPERGSHLAHPLINGYRMRGSPANLTDPPPLIPRRKGEVALCSLG